MNCIIQLLQTVSRLSKKVNSAPNKQKHITSFLTHPFISQTKKSLCRVDCCINLSQYYLSLLGRKIIVGIPGGREWGCDRSGSARVGHAGGAAQSRQFIINNNVGKYQRVWGITTGARRAQRRSNGTTPEKRTADRDTCGGKSRPMVRGVDTQRRPI